MYFYKCSTVLPERLADNKNCSIVYYNDACRCQGAGTFGDEGSDRHAIVLLMVANGEQSRKASCDIIQRGLSYATCQGVASSGMKNQKAILELFSSHMVACASA
jgi:hypothetical protein